MNTSILFLPLVLFGCAETSIHRSSPAPTTLANKPWINDHQIHQQIDAYIEDHPIIIDQAEFEQQIQRSTCKVKLVPVCVSPIKSIYDYASKRTVIITRSGRCPKCNRIHGLSSGTGFFISESGVVATNYHLLDHKESRYDVTTFDGHMFPVTEVLATNGHNDLALLQIGDLLDYRVHAFPLSNESTVGSHIWVIGHPDHRYFTLTDGIISRYRVREPAYRSKGKHQEMMITAPFSPGSSGGPVIDDQGNVVGVVRAREAVGRSHPKSDNSSDIPTQVAHTCIPTEQLSRMID